MSPSIRVRIKLKPSEIGGRQSSISRSYYPFRVKIGERFYDARAFLEKNDSLAPGDEKELTVKFLDPETVIPKLQCGDTLAIWELREVGALEILNIMEQDE